MPLKLNVGVSRKAGLPNYGSVGASCNIEVELDAALLERDPEGFQVRVRNAFAAAQQAVQEELARSTGEAPAPPPEPAPAPQRPRREPAPPAPPIKPATPAQIRALDRICRNADYDLDEVLDQEGIRCIENLSAVRASELITMLQQQQRVYA